LIRKTGLREGKSRQQPLCGSDRWKKKKGAECKGREKVIKKAVSP
jgi:hypothetical protein